MRHASRYLIQEGYERPDQVKLIPILPGSGAHTRKRGCCCSCALFTVRRKLTLFCVRAGSTRLQMLWNRSHVHTRPCAQCASAVLLFLSVYRCAQAIFDYLRSTLFIKWRRQEKTYTNYDAVFHPTHKKWGALLGGNLTDQKTYTNARHNGHITREIMYWKCASSTCASLPRT